MKTKLIKQIANNILHKGLHERNGLDIIIRKLRRTSEGMGYFAVVDVVRPLTVEEKKLVGDAIDLAIASLTTGIKI